MLRHLFGLIAVMALMSGAGAAPVCRPAIQWQQTYGGTVAQGLRGLRQTSDGGYIACGHSLSPASGNKTSPAFGDYDAWVVRLNASGAILWDKTFGAGGADEFWDVQQTPDLGFLVAGYSWSPQFAGNKLSPNYGASDAWLVRLDANGNKLWEKTYGGSGQDFFWSLQKTAAGGFVMGGTSESGISGTKTSPAWGSADMWVVRVDANGNQLWDRSFGGNQNEIGTDIKQTSDGGFVLVGDSRSGISGTKTTPAFGAFDGWIVRLDGSGNQLWDKTFGASFDDEFRSTVQTSDGGFLVGGIYAPGGVNTEQMWVLKLDATGTQQWQSLLPGGGQRNFAFSLASTADGGSIVGGTSASPPVGTKTSPNFGSDDFWVVRLDASGNQLWECSYGGSAFENLYRVMPTLDGGFILGGESASAPGGNKTSPRFNLSRDFWLVKLGPELDTNGPSLIAATARCGSNKVTVHFSEPVTAQSAANPFNYSISGGLVVQSVLAGSSPNVFCLFTDQPFSLAGTYTLLVNNVQDLCGNLLVPNPSMIPIKVCCPSNACLRLACPSNIVTRVPCPPAAGVPVFFDVGITDTCDSNVTLVCVPPSGSLFPLGTTPVLCRAMDDCGNSNSCTFTVSVVEANLPPFRALSATAVCNSNKLTIHFNSAVNLAGLDFPEDFFQLNPGLSIQQVTSGANPQTLCLFTGQPFLPGVTYTIQIFNLTDQCGRPLTPNPTTLPIKVCCPSNGCLRLVCPSNMLVQCEGPAGVPVNFSVSASDNCDSQVTILCAPEPNSLFPVGTTPVTCYAHDDCGNFTNCTFEVTVRCPCLDIANEHVTCPTNTTGKLNYSFDLRNFTGVPVQYLFLVPRTNCFTFMPGLFTFKPPLAPGQTTNVSVMINRAGGCPSNFCFYVAAHDSNFVECCSLVRCVEPCTNAPPIVHCPDPIVVCAPSNGVSLTLTAQATDPDGDPLTIEWRVDGVLVQVGGLTLTHHYLPGTHTVEVRVTDGNSAPVICTTTVTILLQPRLSIRLEGGLVIISWTGDGRLQCATQVTGPWSDVVGATNPYTTAAAGAHKFYRLICP